MVPSAPAALVRTSPRTASGSRPRVHRPRPTARAPPLRGPRRVAPSTRLHRRATARTVPPTAVTVGLRPLYCPSRPRARDERSAVMRGSPTGFPRGTAPWTVHQAPSGDRATPQVVHVTRARCIDRAGHRASCHQVGTPRGTRPRTEATPPWTSIQTMAAPGQTASPTREATASRWPAG